MKLTDISVTRAIPAPIDKVFDVWVRSEESRWTVVRRSA
jgi:hypothetical protein